MLKMLIGKPEHPVKVCQVVDVDTSDYTCTANPVDGTAQLTKVRLSPALGKYALMAVPKKESFVTVVMVNHLTAYVVTISEAEKIYLNTNDGDFGGLVKVEQLVSRLNAIENAFNSFLTEYKTHIHSVNVAGAVTVNLTPPSTQTSIETTQRDQLENTEVVHG